MKDCTRCINFDGALFKDTPYAKDTCKITGGVIRDVVLNCTAFKDRGNKPWSPYIQEKYEAIGRDTYKTITRTTDGEKIRLKAVKDDWIEVDENNVAVGLTECLDDGITRAQRLQIRADILAWVENGFKKKGSKVKKEVIDSRVDEII